MKTEVWTTVRMFLDNVEFGYWYQPGEDDDGEFIPLRSYTDYLKAAKHLGCTMELLDTMTILHDSLLDALKADLGDIWKRLDRIEEEFTP